MSTLKRFDVLDRHVNIHHNYLLEASAGTGKTYSIENIVVRLLISSKPLSLSQILVVTFTRAATRDLKHRIRTNILKTVALLESNAEYDNAPDYLKAILEQGEEAIGKAKKALEQALFCFDDAQIFTIHAFCHRMLRDHLFEGGMSLDAKGGESNISTQVLLQIVRDFLRTQLDPSRYSQQQMQELLKSYKGDMEALKYDLVKTVSKGAAIHTSPCFAEQLQLFQQAMEQLKLSLQLTQEQVYADYQGWLSQYKSVPKGEEKAQRFAALFAKDSWDSRDLDLLIADGLVFVDTCHPENLRKKASSPILHYPTLVDDLRTTLMPLIEEASNRDMIFARLAHDCQKHLKRYTDEEELFGFDDILEAMHKGTMHAEFSGKVRARYRAAIIDEFQDTDPLQWQIFRDLFLSKSAVEPLYLYLVGDPKQSIYAFRHADIYTYLSAAEHIGSGHHASLDTNYRSQPALIDALNLLFSNCPGMIHLPKIGRTLPYQPVLVGEKIHPKQFHDTLGCVHFFEATAQGTTRSFPLEHCEEAFFFPYITQEILRLHQVDRIPFKKFAILVKDRFQAERLMAFLKSWRLPCANQRQALLGLSPAVTALRELLLAVSHPNHLSRVKVALGGPFLGWTHESLLHMKGEAIWENLLAVFHMWHRTLKEEGFIPFFQQFMQTMMPSRHLSNSAHILSREGGSELYQDLLQLGEILAQEQMNPLIDTLDALKQEAETDDEALKRRPEPHLESIQILTIHASKGLEFEIVFALGLASRSKEPDKLISTVQDGKNTLRPIIDANDPLYIQYGEELDAEKMRQLYVAMTRAKYRLYLPVLTIQEGCHAKLGTASPMELFLARLGQPAAASRDELYARIQGGVKEPLSSWLKQNQKNVSITHVSLVSEAFDLKPLKPISQPHLIAPATVKVPGAQQFLVSFSTLAKGGNDILHTSLIEPPHDFCTEHRSPHTLPAGSDSGNLLHQLLETLSFSTCRHMGTSDELISHIAVEVQRAGYSGWEPVIAQMLFNALHVPLPMACGPTPLCQVDPGKLYRETEFLYPWDKDVLLPDMERVSGFLKGVIDLVFYHEGKYYLLDWKSNWLGPQSSDYQRVSMHREMEKNNYFLQAHIYREALKRYLKLMDPRPFEEIFGGTFYIFLRGLGTETGIFKL